MVFGRSSRDGRTRHFPTLLGFSLANASFICCKSFLAQDLDYPCGRWQDGLFSSKIWIGGSDPGRRSTSEPGVGFAGLWGEQNVGDTEGADEEADDAVEGEEGEGDF